MSAPDETFLNGSLTHDTTYNAPKTTAAAAAAAYGLDP